MINTKTKNNFKQATKTFTKPIERQLFLPALLKCTEFVPNINLIHQ